MKKKKKILFVISEMFYSEPLGVMQLSAILKQAGHVTRLVVLKDGDILDAVEAFEPDLVAYSTMSPDVHIFKHADSLLQKRFGHHGPARVMGGAHPTHFFEVLAEMQLDAICTGEGDQAILEIVDRLAPDGTDLGGIKNVIAAGETKCAKEIISDLDSLPFLDRGLIYDAVPEYRRIAIRSIMTSRGCPYHCTYCFNHSYNTAFRGLGPVVRRSSVSRVIAELKSVIADWQPVKIIRFGDDTFVHRRDSWLEEFAEAYRREIGLPFYCLMRSNAVTEDVLELLVYAGCRSISMSIETGDETVRNELLKRNLSDRQVIRSFELADRYAIKTHANSMLGIPGTTLRHDFETVRFVKKIPVTVPSFGIFAPYPGTDLTEYAVSAGILDQTSEFPKFKQRSFLKSYTEKEKTIQMRLAYVAPLFCRMPRWADPALEHLARLPLSWFYNLVGSLWVSYGLSTKIFMSAYPKDPRLVLKHAWLTLRYLMMTDWREQPPAE